MRIQAVVGSSQRAPFWKPKYIFQMGNKLSAGNEMIESQIFMKIIGKHKGQEKNSSNIFTYPGQSF